MGFHFHNNITKIVTPVLLAGSLFDWLWEGKLSWRGLSKKELRVASNQ